MNRGKWARGFVALATVVAWLGVARPVAAQFLAPALDHPGFDRRLSQPSLRLSMLGGVSLLFDDENNELNLWDFGVAPEMKVKIDVIRGLVPRPHPNDPAHRFLGCAGDVAPVA